MTKNESIPNLSWLIEDVATRLRNLAGILETEQDNHRENHPQVRQLASSAKVKRALLLGLRTDIANLRREQLLALLND